MYQALHSILLSEYKISLKAIYFDLYDAQGELKGWRNRIYFFVIYKLLLNNKFALFDSVRVYAVIISKNATKIVGMQNRQVACVHGTQDQKRSTFNKFKPAQ